MSVIFNRVGLLSIRNAGKGQTRAYNMHHSLTTMEVDMVNQNTMNHLPKPSGSWAELNNKRQAVNNAVLVVGSLLFASVGLVLKKLSVDSYSSAPKDRMTNDFVGSKF